MSYNKEKKEKEKKPASNIVVQEVFGHGTKESKMPSYVDHSCKMLVCSWNQEPWN